MRRIEDHVISTYTGLEENEVHALRFHPEEQILVSSDVNGCVHFTLIDEDFKCSMPEGMGKAPFAPHKVGESCRTIDFVKSAGKARLVTGGSDGRVIVSSMTPKVVSRYDIGAAVNVVRGIGENMIMVGDDEGGIHGIDIREKKLIFSIHEQEDYISDLLSGLPETSPMKTVIATSGDCTLAAYDLRAISTNESEKKRKGRLTAMSDQQEDELNCAIVMNNEQHVLTGDSSGVVGIWKQGYWGDLKDRLPLYQRSDAPQGGMDGSHSIDGMKKIDEKSYVVATSDGVIRMVELFPNQVQRIVGVHRNKDDSEIATISAFDCDVQLGLVATAAGDSEGRIKLWSLEAPKEGEAVLEIPKAAKGKKAKKPAAIHNNADKASKQSFFSDI